MSGNGTTLYFPHVASNNNWKTEICLVNTGATALSGELTPYSGSGEKVTSAKSVNLAPNARLAFSVGGNSGFESAELIDHIIFKADSGSAVGYTKFYTEGMYRVAIPAPSATAADDVYVPHIASNSNWWTGISLVNTNASSVDLTINFDNSTSKTITIPGGGHKAFTIKSLFGNTAQPDISSAVIKNAAGIVGLELFGSGKQLSGVLLRKDTGKSLYFPHVVSSDTWWTGIVAYNPHASRSQMTITPYDGNGDKLASSMLSLDGGKKYIGTLAGLNLPNDTAWFMLESSNALTGFELFGTKAPKSNEEKTGEETAAEWVTVTSVPTPPTPWRSGAKIAAADGILYVMGGWPDGQNSPAATAEAYNPATNTWNSVSEMPAERSAFEAVYLDDKIYASAGVSEPVEKTLFTYDPQNDTWTKKAELNQARASHAAAVAGKKIYVAGGWTTGSGSGGWSVLSSAEVYDPATNSWTSLPSLPISTEMAVGAGLNGKFYVMGGYSESLDSSGETIGYNNRVYVYDPQAGSWSQAESMLASNRSAGTVATANGKIYVIGGWSPDEGENNVSRSVEIYDPATGKWEYGPSLPAGHEEGSAAVIDGVIYFMDGSEGTIYSLNTN